MELADALYELTDLAPQNRRTFAGDVSLNEALVRLAVIHDAEVEFRYAKGEGTVIETRRLVPRGIKVSNDGNLSFVGDDPDRDDLRAFRLDRIKGTVAVHA